MQILHFNWLHHYRTISYSPRVAKFAGFSFVLFPNKYIFNLLLLTLSLPFLSDEFCNSVILFSTYVLCFSICFYNRCVFVRNGTPYKVANVVFFCFTEFSVPLSDYERVLEQFGGHMRIVSCRFLPNQLLSTVQ